MNIKGQWGTKSKCRKDRSNKTKSTIKSPKITVNTHIKEEHTIYQSYSREIPLKQ